MGTERERLRSYYNGDAYDPASNPGGMARGGFRQPTGMLQMGNDMAAVADECATAADRADAGGNQSDAWKEETLGAVTRLSGTQVQVAGVDLSERYMAGRPLMMTGSATAYGYVSAVEYSGGNTVITVSGDAVPATLDALYYGQDPRNAPESSAAGDLYFYDNMTSLGW